MRLAPGIPAALATMMLAAAPAAAGEYDQTADAPDLAGPARCGGAGLRAAGLKASGCARISGYIAAGDNLTSERIGGRRETFGPLAAPGVITSLGVASQPLVGPPRFLVPAGDGDIAR